MDERKYDSAPARMRKREVANTWDIQQTADFFAPPEQPSDFFEAPLTIEPPQTPRYARPATFSGAPPRYACGSPAQWNAHGSGSWGRISKRRTSERSEENAMSLWEVSEALKTAAAPPHPSLPEVPHEETSIQDMGMGLLDELVALEAAGQDDDAPLHLSESHPQEDNHCAGKIHPDELLAMLEGETERELWCDPGLKLPETAMFTSCMADNGPASPSPTSVTDLFNTPPKPGNETYCKGESLGASPPHLVSMVNHPSPATAPTLSIEVSQRLAHEAAHHAAQHHANQVMQQQTQSYEAAYQGAYQAAFQAAHQAANQHQQVPSATHPAAAVPVAFTSPTGIGGVFAPPSVNPVSRNGAERKEWTPAEDAIIRQSMSVHGARWRRIAAQLPGRSDDAVRNRWNRLKLEESANAELMPITERSDTPAPPPLNKRSSSMTSTSSTESGSKPERVSWTRAEDAMILQSVQELGHKWNKLAERLPGRTDHAIRNRFHRLQTMLEDKQREQQRVFAPREPLPESTLAGHCASTFVF